MNNQFDRIKALISEEKFNKLQQCNICVVGIGGVGGYICEALARSGVNKLTLIDFDTVCNTNLNRQIIALHSTIGKHKVNIMKERILDINPNCNVETYNIFLDDNTFNTVDFTPFDYVADAIDSVNSKIMLIKYCKENNIPIISSMGTGNKMDPTKLKITDISKTCYCPLAKKVRNILEELNIKKVKVLFSTETTSNTYIEEEDKIIPSSIITIPAIAGLMIANEIIMEIIYKENE